MTVTSVTVATAIFLFGILNCTIDSDFDKGDFFARARDFAHV